MSATTSAANAGRSVGTSKATQVGNPSKSGTVTAPKTTTPAKTTTTSSGGGGTTTSKTTTTKTPTASDIALGGISAATAAANANRNVGAAKTTQVGNSTGSSGGGGSSSTPVAYYDSSALSRLTTGKSNYAVGQTISIGGQNYTVNSSGMLTNGSASTTTAAKTTTPVNLPATPTTFTPDVQAEITRAQNVYNNADTLAGTGKYVGQTADQIRQSAHAYADSLRAGGQVLDPNTGKPVGTGTGQTGPANPQAEITNINNQANTDQQKALQAIIDSNTKATLSNSAQMIADLEKNLKDQATAIASQKGEVQTYQDQRAALGVGPLEDSLNQKQADLAKFDAAHQAKNNSQYNQEVSATVVSRRQSAEDIQYNQDRQNLVADINSISNQLNQKYSVIDAMVKYTGADAATAQQNYQNNFNNTIKVIDLLNTQQTQEQNVANAHLTMLQNLLKDNNLDYKSLDPAMKTQISNLEIQAGVPLGITSFIHKAIKDPTISTSNITRADGQVFTQVISKNADGTVTSSLIDSGIKQKVTSSGGGSGISISSPSNQIKSVELQDQMKQYITARIRDLAANDPTSFAMNGTKLIPHDEFIQLEEQYIQQAGYAGAKKEFEDLFGEYDAG